MEAFFDRFSRIPTFQKLAGMLLICLLIIMGFYLLFLAPIKEQKERMEQTIRSLESTLEKKKRTVSDLNQHKREIEKLKHEFTKALKLLPNKAEIPSLLQKISSLAKKSGLTINSFQPVPESNQKFYAKVPVKLALEGTYTEMVNFFDAISKLSRIINISNISFSAGKVANKRATGKKSLSVKCMATTFRFVPTSPKKAKAKNRKKGKK